MKDFNGRLKIFTTRSALSQREAARRIGIRSNATNADMDTVDWGFGFNGNGQGYRGCISNYRSSSTTANDHSCNVSTVDAPNNDWGTDYAKLSNLPPLLVGDGVAVTSWSVIGLSGLVIPNP